MITSLVTEKGVWGARWGTYDHLLLLSMATDFQPRMFLELNVTRLKVDTPHVINIQTFFYVVSDIN